MCIEKARTEILVRKNLLGQLLFGNEFIFISEPLSLFFIKTIFLIYNILFSFFTLIYIVRVKLCFQKKMKSTSQKGNFNCKLFEKITNTNYQTVFINFDCW